MAEVKVVDLNKYPSPEHVEIFRESVAAGLTEQGIDWGRATVKAFVSRMIKDDIENIESQKELIKRKAELTTGGLLALLDIMEEDKDL